MVGENVVVGECVGKGAGKDVGKDVSFPDETGVGREVGSGVMTKEDGAEVVVGLLVAVGAKVGRNVLVGAGEVGAGVGRRELDGAAVAGAANDGSGEPMG